MCCAAATCGKSSTAPKNPEAPEIGALCPVHVVEKADGAIPESGVLLDLLHHHLAAGAGADDEHAPHVAAAPPSPGDHGPHDQAKGGEQHHDAQPGVQDHRARVNADLRPEDEEQHDQRGEAEGAARHDAGHFIEPLPAAPLAIEAPPEEHGDENGGDEDLRSRVVTERDIYELAADRWRPAQVVAHPVGEHEGQVGQGDVADE